MGRFAIISVLKLLMDVPNRNFLSILRYACQSKDMWNLSEEEREVYRQRSRASSLAKKQAFSGNGIKPVHPINFPKLNPDKLMPQLPRNGWRSLSLFSGCGGLDLGFDRAGFTHVAAYDLLAEAGITLKKLRPHWQVFGGDRGDVKKVDWRPYRGLVDIIHAGPPCQPFSTAGRQKGKEDNREKNGRFQVQFI